MPFIDKNKTKNSSLLVKKSSFKSKWLPLGKFKEFEKDITNEGQNAQPVEKLDKKSQGNDFLSDTCAYTSNQDSKGDQVALPPPKKPVLESLPVTNEKHQTQISNKLDLEDNEKNEKFVIEYLKKTTFGEVEQAASSSFEESKSNNLDRAMHGRKCVLEELIKTEKDYVRDLSFIIDGFMNVIDDPNSPIERPKTFFNTKQRLLFGNIKAIYKFHKDIFVYQLENSAQNLTEIGDVFVNNESHLLMYVKFCQNKPFSDFIVNEYIDNYFEVIRKHLNYGFILRDLMIKPVQRVTKYQLLLGNLLEYSKKVGNSEEINAIQEAIRIMQIVPRIANDVMDLNRIKGFNPRIHALGKLLKHGSIKCRDMTYRQNKPNKPKDKLKNFHLYIFEQLVLFCKEFQKRYFNSRPAFIYRGHINVNSISFEINQTDDENQPFIVKSISPNEPVYSFYCVALDEEEGREWKAQFEVIINHQNTIMEALSYPIVYQNNLRKSLKEKSRKVM